ncbi:MAG: DUF2220 family protein [Chitinophagaceae bacterium]|nr:DUF2220 family protein [Chitinophagaceae bacterium]
MISLEQLNQKIARLYPKLQRAHVLGENIFPILLPVDKSMPDDFSSWSSVLQPIIENSSSHRPDGYTLHYEHRRFRLHGQQSVIVAISFDNAMQLSGYLNKTAAFKNFCEDITLVTTRQPVLKQWLATHGQQVEQLHGQWPALLQLISYFQQHPLPGLFARELPVPVGSKFVEKHRAVLYDLLELALPACAKNPAAVGVAQFESRFGLKVSPPRLRVRVLDEDLAQHHTGHLTDVEAPVIEWRQKSWPVQRVIILENKTNFSNADLFLSLPALAGTVALFGAGKAVATLGDIQWLANADIWYWGDVDAEGFEMLNTIRNYYPHIKALCMDEATWQMHKAFTTAGSGASSRQLPFLKATEAALYEQLCQTNRRLEQEYIDHGFVVAQIHALLRP